VIGAATLLGRIERISGTTLRAALSVPTDVGIIVIEGKGFRIGQVGAFVQVPFGVGSLYGVVTGIGASGEAFEESREMGNPARSWLDVELVGETDLSGRFKRGISQYPTIGDEIHLVAPRDLEKIYGGQEERQFITLGNVVGAESVWCPIDGNKLVTRHSIVVGSTGSGKSTTVATLVRKLVDSSRFPAARVLLIDMHGEYAAAFGSLANVLTVSGEREELHGNRKPLYVPFWALTFAELARICFGELDELAFSTLRDMTVGYKTQTDVGQELAEVAPESLADAPVPFDINKMWLQLYNLIKATHTAQQTGQSEATIAYANDTSGAPLKGDARTITAPTYTSQQPGHVFLSAPFINGRRAIDLFTSRLRDKRLAFMFRPGPYSAGQDTAPAHLSKLLAEWLGSASPISVLDLSGTPTALASEIVGAVLRIVFEALFWARNFPEGGRERPLLIVLEEAHSYLKDLKSSAAVAVDRIVREGRKYGVGCMIISQRPADIDVGVLSQCGSCFAMRMSNPADRTQIANGVSESFGPLMALLPSLRTGEVIVTGEAVAMPVRIEVPLPPSSQRPSSEDPQIYSESPQHGWNEPRAKEDYEEMLSAWRAQDLFALRKPTKIEVREV
jgi:hypothetical protein